MLEIVLTRPEGSANIGAVCRAMKTCNLEQLVLANPAPIDEEEVKKWSLKGFPIYQNARMCASLEEALCDAHFVVGVSRRHGRHRKRFAWTPGEFAGQLKAYAQARVALVFGNEKNGLSDSELKLCHALLSIPTDAQHGSLNLSHAVQVCACAIFEHQHTQPENDLAHAWVTQQQVAEFTQQLVNRMEECALFNENKEYIKSLTYQRIFEILGRVPLHEGELKFLGHTMDKMMYTHRVQSREWENN